MLREPGPETTSLHALQRAGLSQTAIFTPFLAGIFLERELATSSRFLHFVLASLAAGPAAVPARGMGAIADQLADGLAVRIRSTVVEAAPGSVLLESGEVLRADAIVVATPGVLDEPEPVWNGVNCVYFDAPEPPVKGPWLVLDGEGIGPVNNLAVLSEVSRDYAPSGQALVSASVIGGDDPDLDAVRFQLGRWFGSSVAQWRHLHVSHRRGAAGLHGRGPAPATDPNRRRPLRVR